MSWYSEGERPSLWYLYHSGDWSPESDPWNPEGKYYDEYGRVVYDGQEEED